MYALNQLPALRAPLFAGVALVGAGTIAVGPMLPVTPLSGLPGVHAPGVTLTALPSWLSWVDTGSAQIQDQILDASARIQHEIDTTAIWNQATANLDAYTRYLVTGLNSSLTLGGLSLAELPASVVNALAAAIADPSRIPAILTDLAYSLLTIPITVVAPALDAIATVAATSAAHSAGVGAAFLDDTAGIAIALAEIPFLVGAQTVDSGVAVIQAAATLDPRNVISALGNGYFDVEGELYDSIIAATVQVHVLGDAIVEALKTPPAPAPGAGAPDSVVADAVARTAPTPDISATEVTTQSEPPVTTTSGNPRVLRPAGARPDLPGLGLATRPDLTGGNMVRPVPAAARTGATVRGALHDTVGTIRTALGGLTPGSTALSGVDVGDMGLGRTAPGGHELGGDRPAADPQE